MAKDIKKLREKIDSIDAQILKLYEERMDVVRDIGAYKIENNLPIYDAEREDAKLAEVFASVKNQAYADGAAQLFITLMESSKDLQMGSPLDDADDFDDLDFNWDGEPVVLDLGTGKDKDNA